MEHRIVIVHESPKRTKVDIAFDILGGLIAATMVYLVTRSPR